MAESGNLRPVLKPAQEHVLATLAGRDEVLFARLDYEEIAHVSRSQAAYDLADLVKLGLVERLGSGRSTRYRLIRARGGRRRKWTAGRIRGELQAFCDELGRWPKAGEFRDAGHGDLYLAASRYGGIEHWAEELGFREPRSWSLPLARMARTARVVAVAGLAAFGLGLLSGSLGRPDGFQPGAAPPLRTAGLAVPRATPEGDAAERRSPRDEAVDLRLAARGGASWLSVRRGSREGRLVWEGTLGRSASLRFHGERLWLRLGAPGNLTARLNGERVALPARTSILLATRSGLRVLRSAPAPPPALVAETTPSEPARATGLSVPAAPAPAAEGPPAPDPQPGSGRPTPDPRP